MQSVAAPANFLTTRYEQLVKVLTGYYNMHPDATVYASEYREVLARCMASKVSYGVTYEEDIEQLLIRLNRWRPTTPPPS